MGTGMIIRREWAMPNKNTFDIQPIRLFVEKYLDKSTVSVDPFARNKRWATHTNDLNPDTKAEHHLKAVDFLQKLLDEKIRADLIIFDPPYNLSQTKECYDNVGIKFNHEDAKNGGWKREKNIIEHILDPQGIFLNFGWSTYGMGKYRSCEILEILLVCHGGPHYDTICMAERKTSEQLKLW